MTEESLSSGTLSEQTKYWRDSAVKLLGWGTTIFAAVAIIAFNDSQKYELIWPLHARDRYRAIALLVFVFSYGIGWFFGARWIYQKHLSGDVDSTVLPWRAVRIYLWVIILSMWFLALVTTLRSRPPKPVVHQLCEVAVMQHAQTLVRLDGLMVSDKDGRAWR